MAGDEGHQQSVRGIVLAVAVIAVAVIGNIVLLGSLSGSSHAGQAVRSSSRTPTSPTTTTTSPTTTTTSTVAGSTGDLTVSGAYSGSDSGQQSLPFTANDVTSTVVPATSPATATPEVPSVLLLALVSSVLISGAVLLWRRRAGHARA